VSASKSTADEWVQEHTEQLSAWTREIWDLAEPAWREYRSAAWYVDRLRAEGFEVEAGSGGMPTAFSASWSQGDGPTLMTYAEYDAVPGNSQAADTRPGPRPGTPRFAAGHTDPHSALGMGALGGVLAAKHAMERHGLGGTLRITGEPAEKMHGSKPIHGRRGYYDGVDALVSFHPFYMLPLCNTTVWDTQCGAYYSRIYTFVARDESEWSPGAADSPIPASHAAARSPGANVALMTMYGLTKATQESMLPHSGGWSLNEAILAAGDFTADNLPAPLAQIQYSWRTADLAMAESVLGVLDANARHAAEVAHCELETRWVARSRPGVTNHVLADLTYANLERVGAPAYGEAAIDAARAIQRELGMEPMERPYLAACEQLIAPQEAEARLRESMPAWQRNWTSDDYVEMTWYAPTVRLYIARPALAGGPYPTWVANALGGIPAAIDPTVEVAARTIAGTFLDLLADPGLVAAARAEWLERTTGEHRIEPLLPADFEPPLDYPWPEWVPTADGGRRWHNPYGTAP
jgi:aminobenzoyl-glutamate utilization protein B